MIYKSARQGPDIDTYAINVFPATRPWPPHSRMISNHTRAESSALAFAASAVVATALLIALIAPDAVAQAAAKIQPIDQGSDRDVEPAPAPSFRTASPAQPVKDSPSALPVNTVSPAASSELTPFTETMEKAFSLMVPMQYKTKGGMFQYGAKDHRANLRISAADDSIALFMGDNKLAPFAMPDPKLTKHGFKDQTYELRSGMKMLVKPYQPAPAFLTEYGVERWGRNYQNVLCDGVRNQPGLAAAVSTIYKQGPPPPGNLDFTGADAHFHLTCHGKPMVGYLILVEEAITGYGPGMWKVPYVWGYVCAPEEEGQAKRYLVQAMSTLQMSPQWIDKTSNGNRVVGLIMTQAMHTMAATVNGAP